MQLADILELADEDLRAVDQAIRSELHSDVVLVRQVADYIVGGGGKRLRPLIHVLAARALGYPQRQASPVSPDAVAAPRHHYTLAAVLEFIHTATLLHDDVVDGSDMRRGRSTANQAFGNAAAVLVGDFVYSRAFQMMVRVDSMRVMQVLADATNVIAEGEVLQLMNCRDPDVDEARYLQVIQYKTARLFEAATRLAAILAGSDAAVEGALAAYGMHLGTAFQLVDDVLDYSGQVADTGKNLGDDLAEGKVTLPLIHVMRTGTAAQAALVRQAVEDVEREPDLPAVVAAIQACGALDYTRACARREADAAQACLASLPDSPWRQALHALADVAVTRTH